MGALLEDVWVCADVLVCVPLGLYTDESPGLKVDPVVVLVLSLGFIFSVVALHSRFSLSMHLCSCSWC